VKNTKVARIRHKVSMLKQQFLQSDAGLFDQALGEQEIEAVMRELVEPHRERTYPPLRARVRSCNNTFLIMLAPHVKSPMHQCKT